MTSVQSRAAVRQPAEVLRCEELGELTSRARTPTLSPRCSAPPPHSDRTIRRTAGRPDGRTFGRSDGRSVGRVGRSDGRRLISTSGRSADCSRCARATTGEVILTKATRRLGLARAWDLATGQAASRALRQVVIEGSRTRALHLLVFLLLLIPPLLVTHHLRTKGVPGFGSVRWYVDGDGSYMEILGYVQVMLAGLLLVGLAVRRRVPVYAGAGAQRSRSSSSTSSPRSGTSAVARGSRGRSSLAAGWPACAPRTWRTSSRGACWGACPRRSLGHASPQWGRRAA